MKKQINIAIVDDHEIFRNGLARILKGHEEINVVCLATNGLDLIGQLNSPDVHVDIALIDVQMPVMDGFETAAELRKSHSEIKVIGLSVNRDDNTVFRMIDSGARCFLPKDCSEQYLLFAIRKVAEEGNYYDSFVMERMTTYGKVPEARKTSGISAEEKLTEKETLFLKLCCSEKTYKEIASDLKVSLRTVDGYRENLFSKLNIKSRVGLVLYAIEKGIYVPGSKPN